MNSCLLKLACLSVVFPVLSEIFACDADSDPNNGDCHGGSGNDSGDGLYRTNGALDPSVVLPADCYNPDGMDCGWYRQCLAKMFPCTDQSEYAISYGEKFCNLYEDSKSRFSRNGVRWLDAARKCLQVALVPVLYLGEVLPSCEDVRRTAFDSHVRCYVEPRQGVSVCDLSLSDWANIITTVRSSFLSSAWLETLKASVSTVGLCVGKLLLELF